MGRFSVHGDGESDQPIFIAESAAGTVALHIPSPDAVVVTVEKAEEIRQALGAAIGDAQAGPS